MKNILIEIINKVKYINIEVINMNQSYKLKTTNANLELALIFTYLDYYKIQSDYLYGAFHKLDDNNENIILITCSRRSKRKRPSDIHLSLIIY